MEIHLASGEDVALASDVVLKEVLVQRVSNLPAANEYKCIDILASVVYFGQLILKEANVRLETVRWSNLEGEEVVVGLLELPS